MKWPQIPRPWNPAYQEVYDAMTEEERQNSFKIDMTLLIVVLFVCAIVGGCSRVEDTDTPPTTGEVSEGTSPTMVSPVGRGTAIREAGGAPVVVDEGTGCQYLGYSGHGLTPRMAYSSDTGRYVQVGCMVNGQAIEID